MFNEFPSLGSLCTRSLRAHGAPPQFPTNILYTPVDSTPKCAMSVGCLLWWLFIFYWVKFLPTPVP